MVRGRGGGSVKEKAITAPRGAGAAVESEEEVDVVDGSVFLSRSTKKSAGPKDAEPEEYVNDAEPEEEDDAERSESDISAAAGFDFSDDEDVLKLCAAKNSSRRFEWGDLADEAGGRTFSTVQNSCLGTGRHPHGQGPQTHGTMLHRRMSS